MKSSRLHSIFQRYTRQVHIGEFFRWWGAGLLACLPLAVRRLFTDSAEPLVVQVTNDQIIFLELKEGEAKELYQCSKEDLSVVASQGRFPLSLEQARAKNQRIILRLPANKVLSKTISLPAAAENNLRQVIGFEMDRLTPFSADKLYYDAWLIERQAALRRIQLRLVAVPRIWVDDLLRCLEELGFAPDIIEVAGEASGIRLSSSRQRSRKGLMAQRLSGGLMGLLLVLLLTASLLPLWQQRRIVMELSSRVMIVQREAEEILTLRNELEETLESSRFLMQKKTNGPLVIELLNELTRIFPDHTWIEQLTIQGNEVQVRGQSEEASALIAQVESSDLFHQVTFRSPVTVDQRTGKDRFYLSAQIAKES